MRRLGELLLEKGAIAIAELHTALEACHRTGGRLGTQLLRFGFVEEKALLEALAEQFGVPFVPESVLVRASPVVLRCLPAEALRRLQAVPFDRAGNRLQVAFINPREPGAMEELATLTDLVLEPFVATEAAVLRVLGELEEAVVERMPAFEQEGRAAGEWWDQLWRPGRVGPRDLVLRRNGARPRGGRRVLLATYPELVPVAGTTTTEAELLDEGTFIERLREVSHRDEIGDLLLRYASRYLNRLCLFAIHRGKAVGWMARGQAVVVDDVQSTEVSLDAPSVFRQVVDSGAAYIGPIPPGNEVLHRLLSDTPPAEVVVIPLQVKDRTVAVLVGDNPGETALAVPLSELQVIAGRAGIAFEILILKSKIVV